MGTWPVEKTSSSGTVFRVLLPLNLFLSIGLLDLWLEVVRRGRVWNRKLRGHVKLRFRFRV